METADIEGMKQEFKEISNEELLSGKYDERTVLPVLKARGIKEKPPKYPKEAVIKKVKGNDR